MLVRRMVSPTALALFVVAAAAATAAAIERPEGIGEGLPLAQEMVADEKPPPGRAASPLADIPLRTRFPSRTFLPGLPEVGFADPASRLADTDETQLVQLVYDTYSRYSEREDGERVEFELDGFRTIYRPEFDRVAHYPDVMTLGTDWEIETTITRSGSGSDERAWYDARWRPVPDRAEQMPHLVGRSVLDILAIGADRFPKQRRIVAVTTFRVRVSYLGREKTYRASARWMIGEQQELELAVVDNVVPEVGWSIREVVPPAAAGVPEAALPFERAMAASTTPECYSQTWPAQHTAQEFDYDVVGHLNGQHEGVYIGEFNCSCDTSCVSRCDPGFLASACQDYGDLSGDADAVHRPTREVRADPQLSFDGHRTAAQCVSGLGCFVQSCPGGACGTISVQVSVGIGSVTFTTSTPTLLSASFDGSVVCGLCTEQPPDDDDSLEDPAIQGCAPWCGSPIVVDLDRGGFHFTDLDGGVRFDLDGDGQAERLAWLVPGSGDGWLALDRDGDGAITTGAELFGDHTPQPPSAEPHGYLALAVFDTVAEGGDADGAITAADAVFADLRLWLDSDHDGTSQPGELQPLAAAGIRALDLDFVESRRRDRHGNELRYTGRVRLERGATRSTDVFLLRGD